MMKSLRNVDDEVVAARALLELLDLLGDVRVQVAEVLLRPALRGDRLDVRTHAVHGALDVVKHRLEPRDLALRLVDLARRVLDLVVNAVDALGARLVVVRRRIEADRAVLLLRVDLLVVELPKRLERGLEVRLQARALRVAVRRLAELDLLAVLLLHALHQRREALAGLLAHLAEGGGSRGRLRGAEHARVIRARVVHAGDRITIRILAVPRGASRRRGRGLRGVRRVKATGSRVRSVYVRVIGRARHRRRPRALVAPGPAHIHGRTHIRVGNRTQLRHLVLDVLQIRRIAGVRAVASLLLAHVVVPVFLLVLEQPADRRVLSLDDRIPLHQLVVHVLHAVQKAVQGALRLEQLGGAVVLRRGMLADQILHVERPCAVVHRPGLARPGVLTAVPDVTIPAGSHVLVVVRARGPGALGGAARHVEVLVVTEDRRHARAEVLVVVDAHARPLERGLRRPLLDEARAAGRETAGVRRVALHR